MLRLQCLVSLEEVVCIAPFNVSLSERIDVVKFRIAEEMKLVAKPKKIMKLYNVQHQNLTYRYDMISKREVLFLDGKVITGAQAQNNAILKNATQLVPWALMSWYFHEEQFTLPDAVDIVVVWEDEKKSLPSVVS